MKSTLWKLAALAGVMGAGFLVVYQAHTNLLGNLAGAPSSEGEESFQTPGEPDSPTEAEGTDLVTDLGDESVADSYPPPQPDELGAATPSEPTLAWESASEVDPFASTTEGTAGEASTSGTSADSVSPPKPPRSRFAELAATFNDPEPNGDEEPATSPLPTEDASGFASFDELASEIEQEEPSSESADTFNPFALVGETSEPAAEPVQAEPDVAVTPDTKFADNEWTPDPAATADVDPFGNPEENVAAEEPTEPTLTRLDPADTGPSLIAPPEDSTEPEEPAERDPFATAAADASQRAQPPQEEPALPSDNDPFAIAQTSSEELSEQRKLEEPSPFLVLPGGAEPSPMPTADDASQPATNPPAAQDTAAPSLVLPGPSSPSPESALPPAQNEVFPSDGSVEMTVRPRSNENDADPFGVDPSQPSGEPAEPDFDPFGGPSAVAETESDERVEPDPFGEPPANEQPQSTPPAGPDPFSFGDSSPPPAAPAERPKPDLILPIAPFGTGDPSPPAREEPPAVTHNEQPAPLESLVQPDPANQPDRPSPDPVVPRDAPKPANPPLGPEDFVGVGTVGDDSPLGAQQAQITIEKQAPPDAVIGKPLIYAIHVRNIGGTVAENVIVKDVTPKGSRLVGTSPQAELDESSNELIWRLGKMTSGELRAIKIKVVPTHPGPIGSVATVSFQAAVAARTVITAPDLKLAVEGPEEVSVGEKSTYRFTLTNDGSADATGVFIRNIISDGFEHPRGNDLEYEIGLLRRGKSKTVELTLMAARPGEFQNRSVLGADGNTSVETTKDVSVLSSRLTIHREGPANRFVGRAARFTNTITNNSSSPLGEVTLVETVPQGMRFQGASQGGVFDQRGTVTWRLGPLEPGASQQVEIAYVPSQAAEYTTTVKAYDARGVAAEVSSRLVVAGFSSLKVDFAHDGAPVPIGEEVALRLTVKNRGTAAASQVKTLVEVPTQMRFVNAQGPVRYRLVGDNLIEFETVNSLEIGGEQQFDIVLAAVQKGDARVRVELKAAELSGPLNEEELVVIHANQE